MLVGNTHKNSGYRNLGRVGIAHHYPTYRDPDLVGDAHHNPTYRNRDLVGDAHPTDTNVHYCDLVGDAHPTLMPTHCHTQAVLNHYQKALTFCPQPAKIQERIAALHWTIWDIPQAMEHYLQAHALNPQAQRHHWLLYFGLQRLAGLESSRLLEFCQRLVDTVEPNYHHYPNRGFTPLLLSTAYRYLGEGDVATQGQAQRARNLLHQLRRLG